MQPSYSTQASESLTPPPPRVSDATAGFARKEISGGDRRWTEGHIEGGHGARGEVQGCRVPRRGVHRRRGQDSLPARGWARVQVALGGGERGHGWDRGQWVALLVAGGRQARDSRQANACEEGPRGS